MVVRFTLAMMGVPDRNDLPALHRTAVGIVVGVWVVVGMWMVVGVWMLVRVWMLVGVAGLVLMTVCRIVVFCVNRRCRWVTPP